MTAGSVAANLGGVALFALPGLSLTELFAVLRRLPLSRRLAYGFLLGVVVLGGSLFALSHLFGVPLRRPAIVIIAGVWFSVGLAAWAWHRRRNLTPGPSPISLPPPAGRGEKSGRERGWQVFATIIIAAVCLGPLTSVLTSPLADWDGRMTWSPLAAYMRAEGTVDASVLRDTRWWIFHPRYPPLLPLAQAVVQETFGAGEDDQYFRALYAGFLIALLLIVYDGARRASGPTTAALTSLCVAVPPFLSYSAGGATSGNSDLALAGFYGAGLVLLLRARPSRSAALAAGCLLAGAVLTKNEGGLLAVAALLLAAWRMLRRPKHRPLRATLAWLGGAAAPVLAAFVLLASWRSSIPNREDENYFAVLRLADLIRGAFTRLPVIIPEAVRWTFRWSDWLGFWIVFLVVLLAGSQALRRPLSRRMLLAGLAPAVIGWAAYAVSTRLNDLIGESWDRLLIQGLVPLAVVFAGALREANPGAAREERAAHGRR